MTPDSWPFRIALTAIRNLQLEAFSRMEGADADELKSAEDVMSACSQFTKALRRATPKGWKESSKPINENKL